VEIFPQLRLQQLSEPIADYVGIGTNSFAPKPIHKCPGKRHFSFVSDGSLVKCRMLAR
jgi:hypothetical protein